MPRVRRCAHFVPGASEKMLGKALATEADCLVLDFIEEFRAPVVDRTILGLVNKGFKIEQDEQGFLNEKTRKMLAQKVLNRLESQERYAQKRQSLRNIIQMQARHIATYVRGEREDYQPFCASW